MSVRQIGECFYTPSLQPNERLIALALADFADDHGRAWPSLKTIAEKTGYSRRQTQRLVQQLREIGYVEILIEANWNKTPLYQLHPEALAQPETIEDVPLPLREALEISTELAAEGGGDNLTPPDTGDTPGGDTEGAQEVTPPTQGGDTGDTQTVIEPSVEPPLEPSVELARFTDDTIQEVTPRPRNPGWDALTDVFGYDPEEAGERSLWGWLAAKANAEPDPDEAIKGRARAIISQWGAKTLTAASLKKHWQRAGSALAQATDHDIDRLRDASEAAARRQRMSDLEERRQIGEGNGNTN